LRTFRRGRPPTVDLVEHDKSAKKAKIMTVKIKKPTKADYKNVPKICVK
jgi:hypothetical protein